MNIRARLRPKLNVWFEFPWALLIMNSSTAPKKISGRKLNSTPNIDDSPLCPLGMISTFDVARSTPPR